MAIYMYHRIDQDILSRKSSHKDTPISVLFWTFLLGKLINSVISSGPSSAAAEIINWCPVIVSNRQQVSPILSLAVISLFIEQ